MWLQVVGTSSMVLCRNLKPLTVTHDESAKVKLLLPVNVTPPTDSAWITIEVPSAPRLPWIAIGRSAGTAYVPFARITWSPGRAAVMACRSWSRVVARTARVRASAAVGTGKPTRTAVLVRKVRRFMMGPPVVGAVNPGGSVWAPSSPSGKRLPECRHRSSRTPERGLARVPPGRRREGAKAHRERLR